MPDINLVIEGKTDEYVMLALFKYLNLQEPRIRLNRQNARGGEKEAIITSLPKWNEAAKWDYWVVVIDMDNDSNCVAEYRKKLLPVLSGNMIFRIAVRKIESWILADSESLAKYFGVSKLLIPTNPENILDPKEEIIKIARKSKRKDIREDIVPVEGSGTKQGKGYPHRIQEFLTHPEYPWRPAVAQESADSLKRCIRALKRIKQS
ncbi:MAG: hypothetical protein SFZ02_09200 [bacterium]|nr:hypothetical protein [bacterium]